MRAFLSFMLDHLSLLNEIELKSVVATAAELGLKKVEIKRLQRMASEWK
eukprot:COSAG06_NODE_185_length_20838_cov_50.259463_25_plen_49_part_00